VHWLERCRRPTRGPLAAGLSAAITSPAPPLFLLPRPDLHRSVSIHAPYSSTASLRSAPLSTFDPGRVSPNSSPFCYAPPPLSGATLGPDPRTSVFGRAGRPSCSRPSAMPGWPSCSWTRSTLGRPQLLQAQSGPEASQGFGSDPLDPIHCFDSLGLGSTSTPTFVMPTPPPTDFDTVAVTSATTSVAPSDLATTIATI
jgi:hypothetical protein